MAGPVKALTITEAAERLGCEADHVRHLIATGQLPASDIAAKRSRRMWRIQPADVDAFLAARRTAMAGHPSNADELSAHWARRTVRTYAS